MMSYRHGLATSSAPSLSNTARLFKPQQSRCPSAVLAPAPMRVPFHEDTTVFVPSGVCLRSQRLQRWIEEQGGYVHHTLVGVQHAPCGARGVITTEDISMSTLHDHPLILVPENLYMTSTHAVQYFQHSYKLNMHSIDAVMQLALLLAHERQKGSESFWFPYVDALPLNPPNAWQLSDEELRVEIDKLPTTLDTRNWHLNVQTARQHIRKACHSAASQFKKALGITADELFWSYGQVLSRCFGRPPNLGLAPYIDLLNHKQGAATPDGTEMEDGTVLVHVTSTQDGDPRPLRAGEELYVSYLAGCSPLTAFLSFGFVPRELAGSNIQ